MSFMLPRRANRLVRFSSPQPPAPSPQPPTLLLGYTLLQLTGVGVLGLIAGTLGGLLGVGGSVVMIPGLVLLLGRPHGVEQHLYQAVAMVANVAVAIPATLRHRRAGTMVPEVIRWMLPAAVVCIVLGVWLSNLPVFAGRTGGVWLGRVLAVFLVYVAVVNVLKLRTPAKATLSPIACDRSVGSPAASDRAKHDGDGDGGDGGEAEGRVTPARSVLVGTIMGTAAGLLGIGGGALATPLQQTLMRLPLRRCIANSSAVMCGSASLGAVYKNATLGQHAVPTVPLDWRVGLTLGLLLAPTAWLGGRLGAGLTHRLPLRTVRAAFIALMLVAAWRMAAL